MPVVQREHQHGAPEQGSTLPSKEERHDQSAGGLHQAWLHEDMYSVDARILSDYCERFERGAGAEAGARINAAVREMNGRFACEPGFATRRRGGGSLQRLAGRG